MKMSKSEWNNILDVDRLRGLLNALGIGGAEDEVRETAIYTLKSLGRLANPDEIGVEFTERFQAFPALAVSGIVAERPQGVSAPISSVFQAVRHGLIVYTNEGNFYYIGGKSDYWSGGGFYAYQRGLEFALRPADGLESENAIWKRIREAKSNIVVLQVNGVMMDLDPPQMVNPGPLVDCSAFKLGWTKVGEGNWARGSIILSYLPPLASQAIAGSEMVSVPGVLVDRLRVPCSSVFIDLVTRTMRAFMTGLTAFPGVPQLALLTNSSRAKPLGSLINRFTAYLVQDDGLYEACNSMWGKWNLCSSLKHYVQDINGLRITDALIGAPVFSTSRCEGGYTPLGLAGLVYSTSEDVQVNGSTVRGITVIPGPREYTDEAIEEYAELLGVRDVLSESKKYVSIADRAAEVIASKYGIGHAEASAIMNLVYWHDNLDRIVKEAEPFAKVTKRVKGRAREWLSERGRCDSFDVLGKCLAYAISALGFMSSNEEELLQATLICFSWCEG